MEVRKEEHKEVDKDKEAEREANKVEIRMAETAVEVVVEGKVRMARTGKQAPISYSVTTVDTSQR